MDFDKLSDRKKKILNAVVDSYIGSCEPVSSAELKKKYFSDVSSATLRSEMAALEEMGYLVQPHVSSGRIPSTDAYRAYVRNMLTTDVLTDEETALISSYFEGGIVAVDDIMRRTAKVISDVTNYTSVIVMREAQDIKIRKIDLVDVGDNKALVIIVTDCGIISNRTIPIPEGCDQAFLDVSKNKLNGLLSGKMLKDLDDLDSAIDGEVEELVFLIREIIKVLHNVDPGNNAVLLEGEQKIFEQPEYSSDVESAKQLLSVLSQKDKLAGLITAEKGLEFKLKIGDENEKLKHCAIVTLSYAIGDKTMDAGVIGPERMDYNKIKAVLEYISTLLKKLTE